MSDYRVKVDTDEVVIRKTDDGGLVILAGDTLISVECSSEGAVANVDGKWV